MPSQGNRSGLKSTHACAVSLPGGIPAMFEAEWNTRTGRGWYRILAGTPPVVAHVNGDRMEKSGLTQVEFTAVCRRWMLG